MQIAAQCKSTSIEDGETKKQLDIKARYSLILNLKPCDFTTISSETSPEVLTA